MKRFLSVILVGLGIGFLSSCSSTGSVVSGSDAYGYYDDMYYYGYPSYYHAYPYHRPVIHDHIIVVPEKENQRRVIRNRNDVRSRREAVSPNSRRSVQQSNQQIRRQTAPTQRSNTVAPSSRQQSNPTPSTRSNPNSGSRRGNN